MQLKEHEQQSFQDAPVAPPATSDGAVPSPAPDTFQSLLDHFPDPAALIDDHGEVVACNAGAARFLGGSAPLATGLNLIEAVVPATERRELYQRLAESTVRHDRLLFDDDRLNVTAAGPTGPEQRIELAFDTLDPNSGLHLVKLLDVAEHDEDAFARRGFHEVMGLLDRIARTVSEADGLEQVLRGVIREFCQTYGWALGEAWLPAGDAFRLLSVWHDDDDAAAARFVARSAVADVPRNCSLKARGQESGRPEIIPDLDAISADEWRRQPYAHECGFRSACAMPLRIDGDLLAVLVFLGERPAHTLAENLKPLDLIELPVSCMMRRSIVENELSIQSQRLTLALQASRTGTWRHEIASGRIEWDEYLLELVGIDRARFGGTLHDFLRVIAPEDRVDVERAINEIVEHGKGRDFSFHVVYPDGSRRAFASFGNTVPDAKGRHQVIHGVTWEQTSERQAEERIASLARFHSENPNPVFRVRADGVVSDLNAAATQVFRDCCGEADMVLPEPLLSSALQSLDAGTTVTTGYQWEGRDFNLTFAPVEPRQYVNVFAIDVTAQVQAEEALRQMQKLDAVGQLTGGVAHDFNNRLTAILGNLELIELDHGDQGPLSGLVKEARTAAEGGSRLTQQLLAFARSQPLDGSVMDPGEVIHGLEFLIRNLLGEAVTLDIRVAPGAGPLHADRAQVEDALINLAINARDAMPQGGRFSVTAENVVVRAEGRFAGRVPGEYVCLALEDTGSGIPEDARDRIFEPFYSTKAKGNGGSGLGLSMVYGFVHQSDGFITVDSEAGEGTCFKLFLPRGEGRVAAGEDAIEEDHPCDVEEGCSVLVVEDNERVRRVAARMFEDLRFKVHTASNGAEALRQIQDGLEVTMVFSDMVMPGGVDGLKLAREIRSIAPATLVLLSSGYTDNAGFQQALIDQEFEWLGKPYTRASLVEKLRGLGLHGCCPAGTGRADDVPEARAPG